MTISFTRPELPVLADCDVAVFGGSFGGVAAALALAHAGRSAVLVEPRTYLGREVTATLRPWVTLPAGDDTERLPALVRACLAGHGPVAADGEIPLHMDTVKRTLEDQLLSAGVKLVYGSIPVGLVTGERRLQGVVIGNKSGRQVIRCQAAIDATTTATLSRLAGATFDSHQPPTATYAATLEFTGVDKLTGATLRVPAALGLADDTVTVHRGYRDQDHVLVTYEKDLSGPTDDPFAASERDADARRRATALGQHLIGEIPAFASAYLATASYELSGPQAPQMADAAPAWAARLGSARPMTGRGVSVAPAPGDLAGPLAGLWCLNDAARLDPDARSRLRDPVGAARLGDWLGEFVAASWAQVAPAPEPQVAGAGDATVSTSTPAGTALEVREQSQPQAGRDYAWTNVDATAIPVAREVDVLVIGGGTSGAVAGIVAGREGMRTVVVDMNPGLGGTGTYGGITTYWFGQRSGFVPQVLDWVGEMHDRLHLPRPEGNLAHWSAQAKAWALAEQAEAAGVELVMNATVVGALVEDSTVRGVVVATRWGPVALLARVVIDGTGDGDVAAFAGADHVYGSEREHTVMYAYLPQVATPGRPRNVKTSMLDTTNVEDTTRTLLAERRRGELGDHDHGLYIGPRESRHIRGDRVMTFTDQLRLQSYQDVAYIAFANHDMKGESTSDWIRMGLQAPNVEIEIPYGALVPRGLENILVVGKAFSTTHDGLGAPRMQPDLENLGGVAAIAAAMAIENGQPVRDLDVGALQRRLVEEGILPARVLRRELVPVRFSDDALTTMIDELDPNRPLEATSDAEIGERQAGRVAIVDVLCAGPRVVPLLEAALDRALAAGDGPRQVLLARLLAMVGSKAGVDVLGKALMDQLAGETLPAREVSVRHAGRHPPNQGAAPTAANLLYALGMSGDVRALPIWRRVATLLRRATADDLLDPVKAQYYYVSYLAYGAERLGDPRAIPILQTLRAHPALDNQVLLRGVQADYLPERLAYLEILIGRALARCGSPEGVLVLIRYLDDVRTLLAEHAHSELVAITGQDFGKSVVAWSAWLEAEGDDLAPAPWTAPTEPVAAWGETVLVDPRTLSLTERS